MSKSINHTLRLAQGESTKDSHNKLINPTILVHSDKWTESEIFANFESNY